ncbi:MFS transporter [Candidatus Undinarchaeota archaeon]
MKRVLKLLLETDILFTAALGFLGPIYAIFVGSIGGDILDASGAWAAFTFTTGILILLISKMEDKIKDKKKLIFSGYLLKSVAIAGYYFIAAPIHLFLVQIVLGMSEAISVPAYDYLYSKSIDSKKGASQWGLWEGFYNISIAISALIGGVIVTIYGFKILFVLMFLLSLIGLFNAARLAFFNK